MFKRITNPYEYIHTHIPSVNYSIAKYRPISRAYFKLIEILYAFNIQWNYPIRSFHLAEGPGGFIEATLRYRQNSKDQYVGMTLQTNDKNTPGWYKAKKFINRWKEQIYLEQGKDRTGNLFSFENYKLLKKQQGTYDFVTGDGGFDFSICYNLQECMSSRLIFAQIVYAVMLLKENGIFILKLFDCYTRSSLDMIWLLCCTFRDVNLIKPNTSRFANSEKYIVCRNYNKLLGENILSKLEFILEKLETPPPGMNIERLLSIDLPLHFLNKIIDINSVFGQQQLKMIKNTLQLISLEEEERENYKGIIQYGNIQRCVNWCKIHNERYTTTKQTYADVLSNTKYKAPKK
jgi:23S rRNA U2552 (ribose-2'-O)-methylase RlmE/FtsJ